MRAFIGVVAMVVMVGCSKEARVPAPRLAPARAIGAGTGSLPTIVCNGKGGYRIDLRKGALFPCQIPSCFTAHETVHLNDWKAGCPSGCVKKSDGAPAPKDGQTCPKWKEDSVYAEALADSECRAYKADLGCFGKLLKRVEAAGPKAEWCVDWVKNEQRRSKREMKKHCPDESESKGSSIDSRDDGRVAMDEWGEEDPLGGDEDEDDGPSCAVPDEERIAPEPPAEPPAEAPKSDD